jgi:AcrR family transcriptional regulator
MSPRIMPENRIPDIVVAAVSVFSRKGYRLTQMEEIAEEAGVSKATLYYYFTSKIHLFQYVLQNAGNDTFPPPDASSPKSEQEFLRMLKKRLKEGAELPAVAGFLSTGPADSGFEAELAEVLNEIWDINERNRTQIIILEKSFFEFPELAEVYDKYARGRILKQIEEYLQVRMRQGAIKPLQSVRATARFLLESLAWFGFKQPAPPRQLFTKEEVLPDLTAIIASGLKK